MNRKDTLKALLGSSTSARESEKPPPINPPQVSDQAPARVGAGAVRAMGLSLQKLTAEADRGRFLQAQLDDGSNVIELDTESIDPSFISDRLSPADDDSFRELVESIATHGQQVPILVRPHPAERGRFQIAYGHRRVRVASTLKKKVRAIIRNMTDAELVIAQGKENLERRDLSFIERALFAKALEDKGFDRATVIAALTVHKAEMTRFIAVARSIPFDVIQAIGPAPKAGRPRWMTLAHKIEEKHASRILERLFADPSFRSADSDTRFVRVLAALETNSSKPIEVDAWRNRRGQPIVKIERSMATTRLMVDERLVPDFAAFLIDKLPSLYDEFSTLINPKVDIIT